MRSFNSLLRALCFESRSIPCTKTIRNMMRLVFVSVQYKKTHDDSGIRDCCNTPEVDDTKPLLKTETK